MDMETKGLSDAGYRDTTSTGSNDLSKVLIGALAGAAAGSLIAGLFTEKGIEVRSRVGESSRNMANNLKDKASTMTENIAGKVSEISDSIVDKYQATKEGAADLIEKGKQKVGMSSGNTDYKSTTALDEKESGSKILLGALIVSVASTIVWSFATEKGNQTRKRIAEGSKDMAATLKDKASVLADGIADTYEAAKEGATDLLEKEKQRLDTPTGNTGYSSSTSPNAW